MKEILSIGEITLRAFVSIIVLFLLTKLMGKKQISQLTFFDYCIGISIGSIAASLAGDTETPFHYPLIAMIVYAVVATLISIVSLKSLKIRHLFTGTPYIIIENGKLLKKNMKKARLELNELLCECRVAGYFDISEVEFAIMETNGKVSFLPKSEKRPLQPYDMNIAPQAATLYANVIMEGNIMKENLQHISKDEQWLLSQLKIRKIGSYKDIFLATCDENGSLSIFYKEEKMHKHNMFE